MMPIGLVRPWKRVGEKRQGEALVVATRLTLDRYRHIPRFFRWSGQIRRQVLKSDGALGVTLMARPLRGEYYTITAWSDERSMRAFVGSSPHREIMGHFPEVSGGPATFSSWTADASTLPLKWADALAHIDATAGAATTTAAV